MRWLVVAVLVFALVADLALSLTDHGEPAQLGSGARVTKVSPPFVAAPSPNEHRLYLAPLRLISASKPQRRHRAPLRTPGAVSGHACGGDLPPCWVLARESGGDITARNPHSTASGKWQVLDSTWKHFGGFARAYLAPEAVQDAFARLLWNHGRGCSHWSACG